MSPVSNAKYQKQKNIDKNAEILRFLHEHPAGVLATVDPNSDPHATVIYFSIDENFSVKFMTKRGTKKSSNLKYNNRVSLLVFDDISQVTCQLTGTVTEITDAEETSQIFRNTLRASLHTSRSGVPPISKLQAGNYVAYCLKPTEIRMAVFSKPRAGTHEQLFEVIELS